MKNILYYYNHNITWHKRISVQWQAHRKWSCEPSLLSILAPFSSCFVFLTLHQFSIPGLVLCFVTNQVAIFTENSLINITFLALSDRKSKANSYIEEHVEAKAGSAGDHQKRAKRYVTNDSYQ